jgi:hypothetical protein
MLQRLELGRRIAEEESDHLAGYFVETDQWRRIFSGEVDIVYGPKGSGKSAIYTTLVNRADDLFDRGILVELAENPQGAPAFRGLISDPPTGEREFIALWKLYCLSLTARSLVDYGPSGPSGQKLLDLLAAEGLAPKQGTSLRTVLANALGYARKLMNPESVEGTIKLDPQTGAPVGISTKITLSESSSTSEGTEALSLDDLLDLANRALEEAGYELWILLDRLDVAFAESLELEINALRALFKVYLDTLQLRHLTLKVFLRTDIWRNLTREGFREASHVTRTATISWEQSALLNLVMRRFIQNTELCDYYNVKPEGVLASSEAQEALFYRMFPTQVDTGRNPDTFVWMLGRTVDATGVNAPRELIHLLSAARDRQIKELELGEEEAPGENLFTRSALRAALPEVSKARLEMTLYAEHPDLRPRLEGLRGQKTQQFPGTLARIWGVDSDVATEIAQQMVEVGFFEATGSREAPSYKVPFLYRPALELVQGAADSDS